MAVGNGHVRRALIREGPVCALQLIRGMFEALEELVHDLSEHEGPCCRYDYSAYRLGGCFSSCSDATNPND